MGIYSNLYFINLYSSLLKHITSIISTHYSNFKIEKKSTILETFI